METSQMKQHRFLCFVSSLLIVGATIQGCSQNQQVNNSPCAIVNATMESKQNVDLSLILGNDAIKTAIDAITQRLRISPNASTNELTSVGTDAAVRSAEANGKNPMPQDKTAMETYLRNEVVPAIRQSPMCIINYAPPSRSYMGVERISVAPGNNPQITIKNSGQAEADVQILIRQFVNGSEHSRGNTKRTLIPGQERGINVVKPILPIEEILVGKSTLVIAISMSYVPEPSSKRIDFNEAWQYDHSSRTFFIVSEGRSGVKIEGKNEGN
jgi:hypothetical protein